MVKFGRSPNFLDRLLANDIYPIHAVDNVSFSVEAGEKLGIVGESGSGKSTVARAIVQLVPITSGQVFFRGKIVRELAGDELILYRRSVQMVFQNPFSSLNPRMTVAQTLAEPLRKHQICPLSEIEDHVIALMNSVELPSYLKNRRPHELSGGQCQRIAIARALTLSPQVLIADEITSSLDVTIQAQILDLLEKLGEEMNLTILFISHDLGVVQKLCDKVLVMKNGRVVEYGSTAEILTRPREAYTQQLIAAMPRIPL